MSFGTLLPLLVILSSALASFVIFFLSDKRGRLRSSLYFGGEVVKLGLVLLMAWGIYTGGQYELRVPLLPGIDFLLQANELAMLFLLLSSGLWLFATLYSIGYLKGAPHQARFFGFFGLSVSATAGIALSGNLFTFFIFYEMLTLVTYPLVVHRETPEAMQVGRKYLVYTLGGGVVLLAGIIGLQLVAGNLEFVAGGSLTGNEANPVILIVIFALLIGGLGVKNAFVPLHGWLPAAMIAPTPVSALLHGVAVVKAGAFGIVRVIHEVYGIGLAVELGVALPVALLAGFTIIYGSVKAISQDELKKRLAYSTVSQVSFIALGVSLAGYLDLVGGTVHLVHQGIMKVTLFFCAGVISETLGIKYVSKMGGVGRRMPWTMGAFTLGSFGMIGVPPMAGFISKWYLGVGAIETGQPWVVAILVGSTLLNTVYFLPVIYISFFGKRSAGWEEERRSTRFEADWMLLFPTVAVAGLVLLMGLFAGWELSPLGWADLIATRQLEGQFDD